MDRDNIFFSRKDDGFNPADDEHYMRLALEIEQENMIPFIYAPGKIENIKKFQEIMEAVAAETDASVTTKIGEWHKRSGVVSVIGERITVKNPRKFCEAIRTTQGFEVCPKTNGDVWLAFTFRNLDKF